MEGPPRRALRVAAWTVGGVLALVLLLFLVGVFLPARHSVTVSREVGASPDEVWAAITGVDDFPEWRPGVVRAESVEPIGGWPAWREEGPDGTLTFAIAAVEPDRMLVTEIVDEGLPFGGRWTYVLEPTSTGTEVTITEDGFVHNPIYRLVSRFFMGYERTAETYLEALAARVGGDR